MENTCNCVNADIIKLVKHKMIDDDILIDVSEFFKIFGDSTRIKIINALIHSEMCVCDIAYLLGMTHSAISHQLRILKQAKIVKYKKIGKMVYYMLDDTHIEKIFKQGVEHVNE